MKHSLIYQIIACLLLICPCNFFLLFSQAPPLMGWSSWNSYRIHISDSIILRQAQLLVDLGLKDCGYTYINTDDGFFGYRNDAGQLITHPIRFPNGLSSMVKKIHALGLKAGIYSDAGANTCGSIWDKDKNGIGVGLYGHERQDAELFFNTLGFDFIKIDYCGAGQELNLNEKKRYTEICDILHEVSQHPIKINICRWAFPGTWVKNLAASWRISGDIQAKWWSIKHIIEKNLYLSPYASFGHNNDMDMLEIGRGLPLNEEEVHFGIWCMMSSPLLIGCKLDSIPPHSLQLLKNKELIAINQDPLGEQAYVVQHQGDTYIFARDLKEARGEERAIAFYNPTDTAQDFRLNLSTIDYDSISVRSSGLHYKDLLKTEYGVIKNATISTSLPPRSVKIWKTKGKRSTEPTLYEAEWAYLEKYSDLPQPPKTKTVHIAKDSTASGQAIVRYAGGDTENSILWDKVYCDKGGIYDLDIYYKPEKFRDIVVLVNREEKARFKVPEPRTGNEIKVWTTTISLNKGYNNIELISPLSWLPDLDCIKLRKRTNQ